MSKVNSVVLDGRVYAVKWDGDYCTLRGCGCLKPLEGVCNKHHPSQCYVSKAKGFRWVNVGAFDCFTGQELDLPA